MNLRKNPQLAKTWLFFLLLLPLGQAAEAAKPNVLFIAVDDLNDWIGVLGGHPQARTPNIDRLARRGTLFTNAHCSAPGCNASRSSLLSGLRPSTTGIYANAHDWRQAPRLKGAVTLPRHFRDTGYLTLGAGKLFHAHTFFDKKNLSGYPDPGAWHDYFPSKTQQMPEEAVPENWPVNSSRKFYRGHFDWVPLQIPNAEMADAKVVSWAAKRLAKRHEQPLFLSVGIYRPHVPWYALAFADEMVGELLDALDNGPMAKDTLIVFWGDHGYHLGEKESWEKFALWEDTTRVPLIIVDPGRTKPGTHCDSPVSLLDLYPTLIELCGLGKPPQSLEGSSLAKRLAKPGAKTDRVVITTQGRGNHAVRSSRYRYIRYADGSEELYDHETDPHEWHNLAGDPGLAKVKLRLAKRLPAVNAEPLVVRRRQ